MNPGLDGGELGSAREDQGRHQRDLGRGETLAGRDRAEEKADGNGRDRGGRDVAQACPRLASERLPMGICLVHDHARLRPYAETAERCLG
jgi:hypothetical protein